MDGGNIYREGEKGEEGKGKEHFSLENLFDFAVEYL
jgi:hypothetical protein